MKTVFLFTLTILTLVYGCDCNGNGNGNQKTIEWLCGQTAAEVTKTFKAGAAGNVSMTLENVSLCASSGIRILVLANNQQVYQEMAIQFPFVKTLTVDPNADVSFTTEVAEYNPDVQCVQLGDAKITVKY